MNEIKRFEFEGKPLEFRQSNGEWWATAEEAATLLGHKSARAVLNLYNRNKAKFRDGESRVIDVITRDGKPHATRVFSPRGIARLCMLGRTAVSFRLHDWMVYDVMETLRTGGSIIPADRLASLEAALATLLEDRKADRKLIEQLGALAAASIGHAGKMLSTFARSPEAKAYRDARIREGKDRKALEEKNRIHPLFDGDGAPV